tara:strand:+ start:54409 stop:54858 length:450 start_codon:yes stop_codon:yes gene_type:complete
MNTALIELFNRDLDRLKNEVAAYKSETVFWKVDCEIKNSGGNLTLHLIGNLNHFIGAIIGNSGFVRQREQEFSDKNTPRHQLLEQLDEVKKTIEKAISPLSPSDFAQMYPVNIRKEGMTTQQFLMHLYGHLNYHLGQINYHRRLLDTCS